ncbi:MAG: TonB-dependent receptor [Bacteroidales bacterium]|nr:TonB-dependent receptor [Bacteroidales bacterium]
MKNILIIRSNFKQNAPILAMKNLKSMLKIGTILSIFLGIFVSTAVGQRPGGYSGERSIISGKVVDASSNDAIEFATIAVMRAKDSSVIGIGSTASDGSFTIQNIPTGHYKVKVSFVGYKNFYIDTLRITPGHPVNLGTIALHSTAEQIGEVVVKGERPMIESKIDRKVFYVDKNVLAQSGNATDVLQQVPSVQVDAEGNVSLRGSENVNILINGKPSTIDKTILLQQLPATSIEKIEVITNPSAKYDPEGTGGIINIVLKEGAGTGTNGSISVNATTNEQYNASANFSYNPGKLTLNGSYSLRDDKRSSDGWSKRTYLFDNSIHNTESIDKRHMQSQMARLSADYNFTRLFSAGAGANFNWGDRRNDEQVNYTDIVSSIENLWLRSSDEKENSIRSEYTAYLLRKFDTNGHEWRLDYNYNTEKEDENNLYLNRYLLNDSIFGNEKENNSSKNYRHTIQSDYTWPINDKIKLEAGLKFMFLQTENILDGKVYDFNNLIYLTDTNRTSAFYYDENTYAGYSTLSYSGEKIGIMLGLRYEYFVNNFHLLNQPSYSNTFPAFFPSIHSSYKFNENNEMTLNYSRRVNRPRSMMINPFPDYTDPQNLRTGNPHLLPEYINSFEVGYNYKIGKWNIQPTMFYRTTDNMFSRLVTVDTIKQVTVISFQNSKQSSSWGTELNVTFQPLRFWFINAGASVYQMELNSSNLNNSVKQKIGYNGKIMSNTMLPGGLAIQLSAFYRSPFITPQGESDPFYAFNMGVRKEFLKGKLTGTLAFNDIFRTMHFGMKMSSEQQIGQIYRQFDSQAVAVGLTYKFGQNNNNNRKPGKKNNGNDQTDEMNNEMMF